MMYPIDVLQDKARELSQADVPIRWTHPPETPPDPLNAQPEASWAVWNRAHSPDLECHKECWVYGEVTLPDDICGLPVDGAELLIHVDGWVPFTLWIDGEEMFHETGNWHATGPIAAPLRRPAAPGQRLRLVVRQYPTATPSDVLVPFKCQLQLRPCLEREIDVASAAAQLRLAEALAETAEEKSLVRTAAGAVDAVAIREDRWDAAQASLLEMEDLLAPLSPRAKEHVVHLIGHTHIDLAWLWTWEDTVLCTRRDFKATADLMTDVPDLTFANSQIPCFEIVQQHDPDIFVRMKALMAEGRWENVAAMWNDTDLAMVCGESLARHALYAEDWCRTYLGQTSRIFWGVDVFGHPGNMPQVARLSGAEGYYQTRCHPNLEEKWPYRHWEGVDGTEIPTLFTHYGGNLDPLSVLERVLVSQRCGYHVTPMVWGIVDHGGGMSRLQLEILSRYRNKPLIPSFEFSTPSRVLKAYAGEGKEPPRSRGETHYQFAGCFTTHADVKRYNRECESQLLTAEALSALAGIDRRADLRTAWTDSTFNQFHDVLCGCSAPEVYTMDVSSRGEKVLATAREVHRSALDALAVPDDGKCFSLLNPLGFARAEPVRTPLCASARSVIDRNGRADPVQSLDDDGVFMVTELPAFSAREFTASAQEASEPGQVEVADLDDCFRVETKCGVSYLQKDSGVIVSHYDKALGRELIHHSEARRDPNVPVLSTHGLNLFQVTDRAPTRRSAWQISDTLREEHLVRNARVQLVEQGPVFARFRADHDFRSSHISEYILFYRTSPRIDFEATIDWQEPGGPEVGVPHLQVSFGARMSRTRARSEGPFCVAERPADGTEQPMQTWVDLVGDEFGICLLNDGKYGYNALGSRVQLSLLRTAYAPDPDSDRGEHRVRFAFLPHAANVPVAELVKAGMGFNRQPVSMPSRVAAPFTGEYFRVTGAETVVCTALRTAEHSERTLVRLYETGGQHAEAGIQLGNGIAAAEPVDFLERPHGTGVSVKEGIASVSFSPYEIKTLLLDLV